MTGSLNAISLPGTSASRHGRIITTASASSGSGNASSATAANRSARVAGIAQGPTILVRLSGPGSPGKQSKAPERLAIDRTATALHRTSKHPSEPHRQKYAPPNHAVAALRQASPESVEITRGVVAVAMRAALPRLPRCDGAGSPAGTPRPLCR